MTSTQTAARSRRRPRGTTNVDAPTASTRTAAVSSSTAAADQARFGNAAVARTNASSAGTNRPVTAEPDAPLRDDDRAAAEPQAREQIEDTGGANDDNVRAGRDVDRERPEEDESAATTTAPQSVEQRRIRRYARELRTPERPPSPERLAAIVMMPPKALTWEPMASVFRSPGTPDFRRLSRGWRGGDPADAAEVRREAVAAFSDVVSGIRRHHDSAAMEANFTLQSIASVYSATSGRLQSEFLRTDFETEMIFNQSLAQAEAGATAADQVILRNYMVARRSLSSAAASSKRAIQANKDDSENQITDILEGLREGFVTPLTEARQRCQDQSRTSEQALRDWKDGLARRYPDSDGLSRRIQNEAKRVVGPGLADDALDDLATNTENVVDRFTTNISAVRSDIEARVAPSLRAYTGTMVEDGNEDVDNAFDRAFSTLKRQANQAREAIAESHVQIIAQLTELRSTERERLEMLKEQTLDATYEEASAAADLVVSTTEAAVPHYAGAAEQLADSMTEAARQNKASLRNMAGAGAAQVSATVDNALQLQQRQLDTAAGGLQSSLNDREIQIRTELTAVTGSASQGLQGLASTGAADMLSSAGAMTEGLSTLSSGVTAAAQQWLRPLSEAFSNFLDETRADLERGRPAFLERVGTAKTDFLRYATQLGAPDDLFQSQLESAADGAVDRADSAVDDLISSLDAGIFDVIDETGVGNALRGLTRLQGQYVRARWPFSSSNWPGTIPRGLQRAFYAEVTGSREYTLDGHLMFALGPGSSDYNAAVNYLVGNTAAGARYELEASIHWYNDEEERIQNIQESLTQEQLEELRGMEQYQENTRERVRSALDGTDLNVFDALEEGDHARAEAYRMRDALNNARNRDQIDKTHDILSEYSTETEWGGERVTGAARRAAVQLALAEIRGTSREELEARAAEQNREREAAAREEAAVRERQAREAPPAPSDPTTDETLQMCLAPPAGSGAGEPTIDPQRLESRLPDAGASSRPASTPETSEAEGASTEEQPSLAERWMQGTAPPPATTTAADLAAEMLYEYATRDIEQVRSAGRGGTYTVTLSMTDRERDLARALIFHGEGSPEANAARLGVEVQRSGKPNIVNVDRVLVNPRLNPDSLAKIDDPTARQRVIDNAQADRERMLAIFARDYGGLEGGSTTEHTDILIGQLEAAFGSDSAGAELAELLVRDEYPTPSTAAKAVEYSIEGVGTNNELYFRVTERLNREQYQGMRRQYRENTGRDMYADLGLFGHGLFGDLSGDDRLRAERGTLGRPRNDMERAEVAAFAIHQQREETGWLGGALASGSMQEVLLDMREAELNAMIGGPIEFGPEATPSWTSTNNFDANKEFVGDASLFRATASSAQRAAQHYSAKVDQFANFAATTIAVAGAVVAAVATVLTGGAASPLLLASIAAITGLTAMGAQAAIKGGRYGWEQAVTDLGMTAVQALTAGVGQGLALASRGGMAGLQAGMKTGLSMSAARQLARRGVLDQVGRRLTGNAFIDKVLIGMGTGALGATGSAALEERTWAQGGAKGIENLFAASFRGTLSGGVTAGVTNAIEDVPLGRLSKLVGTETFGEAIGSSTSMLGRGLGKGATSGVGAFAGRASELGFESARGAYQGDAGDIFVESAKAGGMSLLQSIGEGGAEARAQAIFNARYGGQPPIETERAVAREAEAARLRMEQIDAQAEAAATREAHRRRAQPAVPKEISRRTPVDLEAAGVGTGRRPTDLETLSRAPAEVEAEQRRMGDLEDVRRARHEEAEELESSRPLTDEAEVVDLEQARRALSQVAETVPEEAPAMPAKAGAAAAIESSQMGLLPEAIETTPAMLRDATTGAVARVSSLSDVRVTAGGDSELRVQMTRVDGTEVTVKVEFGETRGGDIASFRTADPGDDVQFIVTLSNRAHPDVHTRAIGHELAEIRLHGIEGAAAASDLLTTTIRPGDDARLSAHDVGRLAELEVVAAELAAARSIADDPNDPVARRRKADTIRRLEDEIDTLGRHLGLVHGAEDDIRLNSAVAALPDDSPSTTALMEARQRADVLAPARVIETETRLTAADLERLGRLNELAEALETARTADDPAASFKARRDLEDLLDSLGLNDTDAATERRVQLALSELGEDSPAGRVLTASGARATTTRLNDALRPGLKPDNATVLSSRDLDNIAELAAALRQLSDAEARGADPVEIARLRHAAEAKAAEMGLVYGDDMAMARARFLESHLSLGDLPLIPRLDQVRESARSSALLQPRRGSVEDLPLLARQIAEARAMGDMDLVARLTEIAGFRIEQSGVFDADDAVRETARQHVATILGADEAAHALAVDAFGRHSERLRAAGLEQDLESVRVSIEEVRRQLEDPRAGVSEEGGGQARRQMKEDLEALRQRRAKLQNELALARRVAFRPPDTTEAAVRAAPPSDVEFRTTPLLGSDPDFAGSAEQVRLVRQRYGDSPMFQSWQRFKQMYMELNPSVKANTVRSNTKRDSDLVIDALELERLFGYWMQGRYVNPGAPRSRNLPDLPYVSAGKGDPVEFADPVTGAPVRLSPSNEVALKGGEVLTPNQAATRRRNLMRDRDILQARLDLETDNPTKEQLTAAIKDRAQRIIDLSEAMGEAAGLRFAKMLPGGSTPAVPDRGAGTTDVIHIDPVTKRVSVIECKGGTSQLGSRTAQVEGRTIRAEQTTPEYLRSLANEMMTRPETRDLGRAIIDALDEVPPNIDSYVVRQPFDSNGNPGPITVTRYPVTRSGT